MGSCQSYWTFCIKKKKENFTKVPRCKDNLLLFFFFFFQRKAYMRELVPCIRQMHCQEWESILLVPRVCPCKRVTLPAVNQQWNEASRLLYVEEWPPASPPSDSSASISSIPSDPVKNTLDSSPQIWLMEITSYFIMKKKKLKKIFPLLSTFQLSSVSKGTKNSMLIRILNLLGTCWFMVSPLDILDGFECRFRFFILRMRLNVAKGI